MNHSRLVHPDAPRLSRRAFLAAVSLESIALTLPAHAAGQALRVGWVGGDAFAEAVYAHDMGFFAKAGLDVTPLTLRNGSAVAAAVASGALDIGISNPVQLASAVSHGLPFVIFAGGGLYNADNPTTVLCVAKHSPMKTVKDLEGKTIGVGALGDLQVLAVKAYLMQYGADVLKVQFIEIPFPEMGAAIQTGNIAAAVITEPLLTAAKDAGYVQPFANVFSAIARRFYVGNWFTTASRYKDHAELNQQYAAVMYETARWANAHHDRSAEILSQYTKIDTSLAQRMSRVTFDTGLNVEYLRPPLEFAAKFKLIGRFVEPNELIAKTGA